MEDRFQQVFDKATEREQAELTVLHNAEIKTLKEYQNESTANRKRDWDAARDGLGAAVERLWNKYFHEEPAFPNLHAALKYLQKEDYKIGKQKIYDDRKKGLIKVQPDRKSVLHVEVKAYAATYLKKAEDKTKELSELHEKKSKEEISKIQIQAEKLQFELEVAKGKYVLKKDVGIELAARAGMFEAGLKHLFQVRITDYIYMIGGDPKKAQVLLTTIHTDLDELLNQYASMSDFQVLFEGMEN